MKIKIDPVNVILLALIFLFLILWLASCNPVKQVLNDRGKLDAVAKEVVKMGYCANDTTFIVKSDTLIEVDTLIQVDTAVQYEFKNDTTFVTKWKTRDILKSVIIHDTIKSVIVDNARLNLLQADLTASNLKAMEWEAKAEKRAGWIIILIMAIAAFIYLKYRK